MSPPFCWCLPPVGGNPFLLLHSFPVSHTFAPTPEPCCGSAVPFECFQVVQSHSLHKHTLSLAHYLIHASVDPTISGSTVPEGILIASNGSTSLGGLASECSNLVQKEKEDTRSLSFHSGYESHRSLCFWLTSPFVATHLNGTPTLSTPQGVCRHSGSSTAHLKVRERKQGQLHPSNSNLQPELNIWVLAQNILLESQGFIHISNKVAHIKWIQYMH